MSNEYQQYEKDNPIICPDCGSNQANVFLYIKDTLGVSDSFGLKVRDRVGNLIQKYKKRHDISEKTKRPVIITKHVDRSNPHITRFHHKVEELDEHGILYRIIHEHIDINKSKHRK